MESGMTLDFLLRWEVLSMYARGHNGAVWAVRCRRGVEKI